MWLIHLLAVMAYANDSCDKICPKGHAVCINSLGVPDLSNKDKCYVTKDMATTHTCNSATGKVQLEARISKDLIDAAPEGFYDRGTYFVRFYQVNELEADSDTDFLNLSVKVTIEGEKFGDLALEADINLSFVCKYSLADKEVSSDFTVTSEGIGRECAGHLIYVVVMNNDRLLMGDQADFVVRAVTPGIIFAQVTECWITYKEHKVTIFGEDGNYCMNPWIDFRHRYGLGSKGNQAFTYTAFKWWAPACDCGRIPPQKQELHCKVAIRSWPYPEVVPEQCDSEMPPSNLKLKSAMKGSLRRFMPCHIFKTGSNKCPL